MGRLSRPSQWPHLEQWRSSHRACTRHTAPSWEGPASHHTALPATYMLMAPEPTCLAGPFPKLWTLTPSLRVISNLGSTVAELELIKRPLYSLPVSLGGSTIPTAAQATHLGSPLMLAFLHPYILQQGLTTASKTNPTLALLALFPQSDPAHPPPSVTEPRQEPPEWLPASSPRVPCPSTCQRAACHQRRFHPTWKLTN